MAPAVLGWHCWVSPRAEAAAALRELAWFFLHCPQWIPGAQEKGCKGHKVHVFQQWSYCYSFSVIPGCFHILSSEGRENDYYDKASMLLWLRSFFPLVLRKGGVLLIYFHFLTLAWTSSWNPECSFPCDPASGSIRQVEGWKHAEWTGSGVLLRVVLYL